MKTRNLLAKKTELIYNDINEKRDAKMRLETYQKFKQRKIFELNKKFYLEMYSTNLRGGKAFAAEQKIRGLKKTLLRSNLMEKFTGKQIKPNELIKKVTFKLNNTRSAKYGYSPQQIEVQALDPKMGKYFQEVYDFDWLIKVKENRDRLERFDAKVDEKRLREPLDIDEKVLVLAERLRKNDAPGRLYKSTTENITDKIFTISARSKLNNGTNLYWLNENGQKIKGRFLRQELFALKNQFVE